MKNVYNLELMETLNAEYSNKPLVKDYAEYTMDEQLERAAKRLENLNKKIALNKLKVLEIGCGGGYVSYLLAQKYECDVTGIDIYSDSNWEHFSGNPKLRFLQFNICEENILLGEEFDLIVSYVAWEHIKKPFEALYQVKKLLKPGGKFYLYAWLYRSPMASHLYRHIFFPYPHLLFDDELVKKYALSLGVEQWWINSFYDCNKLTYAEYKEYFSILGFSIIDETLKFRPLDVDFYKRFEDKLGLYPVYDLTLDYFAVVLDNCEKNLDIAPYGIGEIEVISDTENDVGREIGLKLLSIHTDLEYAWDIFIDNEKIKYIKWGEESVLNFCLDKEGEYKFKCYIRRKGYNKRVVRTWSTKM